MHVKRYQKCRGCGRVGCKDGRRPEPSKWFGVWDPHENPGHRPNDRDPVTSQSELESGKHLKYRWRMVQRCVVTPRFPVDKRWKGKMTTRCLQCAVLMSSPKSFINASTAPGESIHHDTLNVPETLLYSAGEGCKHFRFRKDYFVSK